MGGNDIVATSKPGHDGLAARYASALYDLADEAHKLDNVAADLKQLAALIDEVPDLKRLIMSPVLARDAQANAIEAVLVKIETDELVRKFIGVVALNRRLSDLPAIIRAYLAELAARRGETTAEIVSAAPLSPTQADAVLSQLRAKLGAKVVVDQKVDASLIGGLIVKIGSTLIDNSLKSKLARLQLAMKGIG
jgi:F-type H+-transporting ATPase subunit delta